MRPVRPAPGRAMAGEPVAEVGDGRVLRLIVSDVEGCVIPGQGRPWDLAALAALAEHNRRARSAGGPPALTLCSGRPAQYVEALGQALGLTLPACCENGAVLYHPGPGRVELLITEEQRERMARVREAAAAWCARQGRARAAVGKEACVSLIPVAPGYGVEDLCADFRAWLADGLGLTGNDLNFTFSAGAVDVTPAGVDKATGVRALAERLGVGPSEILGIGDSHNDIPFLGIVGVACAPANASPAVRALASYVSPEAYGRGVVDILRRYTSGAGR